MSNMWAFTSMVVEVIVAKPPNNPLQPTVGGLGGDLAPRWAFARRG
jgi:hypothetical protein